MKTNRIIALAFAVAALSACGKQQLPYDLEGTEHSVVINIRKVSGSSTTLATDMSGDYKVLLTIADQQGDYSMLKEAQLMAIYTDGAKKKTSAHVVTGITEFPATLTLDMADVCSKLGISAIAVGDRIEFTPCVTLNSGTQVDGWSALTGFNNTAFTGWTQSDGGNYTYRIAYTAFAPFQQAKFQGAAIPWSDDQGGSGTCKVTQLDMSDEANLPAAADTPVGVTASDLVGLRVDGEFWFGTADEGLTMWINTQDYTLIIPDQQMSPSFSMPGYGDIGMAEDCEGDVDTLNNTLTFTYTPTFGGGYWWGVSVTTELDFN